MHKLLEKGADVSAADRDGNTVLHEAARSNGLEGGCSSSTCTVFSLITFLALSSIAVKLCLDAGIDIDAVTVAGNTALHYTCMWGALECMAELIDRGAAVNITNNVDKSVMDVMLSISDIAKEKVISVYNEVLLYKAWWNICCNDSVAANTSTTGG